MTGTRGRKCLKLIDNIPDTEPPTESRSSQHVVTADVSSPVTAEQPPCLRPPPTPSAPVSSHPASPKQPRGLAAPLQTSEREQLYEELNNLRAERDSARARVEMLEKRLNASKLMASAVQGNNDKCRMLTGITWEVFEKVFGFLSSYLCSEPKNKSSLPLIDQLFITLVKLRHNLPFELLAQVKGIPTTAAIDYFWKWVDLIYSKLGFMIKWQDRDTVFQTIPPVFKAKFPRLTSIVDCIEILIDAPKDLKARAQTWSKNKKHCTVKVLVSYSPVGSINFLSCVWGGRATDVHIARESGFISSSLHMPGDQILADGGFLLHEDLADQCGAELLTPASTKGKKKQLSPQELETSRKISSVRVHMERVIGLLENRYTVLQGPLPVSMVQSPACEMQEATSSIDKLVCVCAVLINLGESIFSE